MDRGNANHHFAPGGDGAGAVQGRDERRRRLLRAVTFPVAADQVLLAGVGGLRRAGRSLALRRWARVMSGAIGGSRASAGVLSRYPLDRPALGDRVCSRTFLGRRQRVCAWRVYCSVFAGGWRQRISAGNVAAQSSRARRRGCIAWTFSKTAATRHPAADTQREAGSTAARYGATHVQRRSGSRLAKPLLCGWIQ